MGSVLFVCLGNICRSPAAEGVLRHYSNREGMDITVESCGLGDWHKGQLPDLRMRDAIKNRGIVLTSRAQKFELEFFEKFDLILVADHKVMKELYQHAATPEAKAKMHLITHFSYSFHDQEVPDPYYSGEGAFEHVLNMLEDSCEGVIQYFKEKRKSLNK